MDANLHAWRSKMQTNVKPVSYSNDDNLKKLSFLMDDLNTFFNTRLRRTNTFCVSYLFLCEPLIEHWGHTVTVEGGGEDTWRMGGIWLQLTGGIFYCIKKFDSNLHSLCNLFRCNLFLNLNYAWIVSRDEEENYYLK